MQGNKFYRKHIKPHTVKPLLILASCRTQTNAMDWYIGAGQIVLNVDGIIKDLIALFLQILLHRKNYSYGQVRRY